ncbi:6-phosphogluconolactonase [Paenibacillus curdlanolyticus YK9]|uniref:6-phosphogluconolactonase n=1 Tax=Paenibacillus curdlanolyticus YK9 TaxID=717606 RepID=E0I898_9BACL|nr:lactonase family protein [Paenibacillus curdlanolyticus]EFM11403.1 6-phosphogluconolactonase [Paenibacillus curdlanolyticus YK9]
MQQATNQTIHRLVVGSYNTSEHDAIHLLTFDTESGKLHRAEGQAGVENPSFVALDSAKQRLYAVSELGEGAIVAYRFTGCSEELVADSSSQSPSSAEKLAEINRQPSGGDSPCHLALDASGQWLLLVNYGGGPISVYPIGADGAVGPASHSVTHTGSSVNPDRQQGSHPHSIYAVPQTDLYLVNDLGTDAVYAYRLDRTNGTLSEQSRTRVTPGTGPRHLAFHPIQPIVYVIEELTSAIAVFQLNAADGSLAHRQTITTLPTTFTGENTCAEVAVSADGRYLYGSNRGHDSIASFRIGEDGLLAAIGHTPSGGQSPRHFQLIPGGQWLLTANQESDRVAVLAIDGEGRPTLTDEHVELRKPVCIRLRP